MKSILFFTAFIGVFILLNMYISKRLISKLDISNTAKQYLRLFLVINFIGILCYVAGRYYIDMPNWLYFIFSLPIGIVFLLFCTAIIYDISRVVLSKTPVSDTKRKFLKSTLDISAFAVATAVTAKSIYDAQFVKLEHVKVVINKLKKEYKIVQLSDVHIGGLIDEKFIWDIVKRVNLLKPDLVVITGDLIDVDVDKVPKVFKALEKLSSTYGTYFIVGNHEYFHNIDKIIAKVKSIGIRVLENENVYVGEDGEGFNLVGVYDLIGYRSKHHVPSIEKALRGIKKSPTILLAHQPRYIHEVTHSVDLMLSGHTHGGQLYPFKFLVGLMQPYISGLHQHNEKLQIYVNKGTGFWGPPMRLGASSEITEIMIQPKS
ncbi:metallophosphoesterase [Sulfurimonas sp.]|nr:metallophosphoesterase [Sulfurimonas sp.]